jgi:hypothetical protein
METFSQETFHITIEPKIRSNCALLPLPVLHGNASTFLIPTVLFDVSLIWSCASPLFAVLFFISSKEWSEFWEGCGWRRRIGRRGPFYLFNLLGQTAGRRKVSGNIIPHQTPPPLQARNHMSLPAANFPGGSQHARLAHTTPGCSERCSQREGCLPPDVSRNLWCLLTIRKVRVHAYFAVNVLFMSLATRLFRESTLHISGDTIVGGPVLDWKIDKTVLKFQPWINYF